MRGEGVVVQTLAELPFPTAHSCILRSYVAQKDMHRTYQGACLA